MLLKQSSDSPRQLLRTSWRSFGIAAFAVIVGASILTGLGSAAEVPLAPESQPGATLSEKLDRSKGVLRPPADVDPEIHTPAPDPNPQTTPVIPPPGTPGGDPNVQPK